MVGSSIAFDRAADYYDETRGYPEGIARRVAGEIAIAGELSGDEQLLEIGVGTGRMALPLSRHVARVVGVDLAMPMLRRLVHKRRGEPVVVLRGDVEQLPFPDDFFDRALSMHIFHLVSDWRAAVAELARVLRPGALLLEASDGYHLRPVWDEVNRRLPWNRSKQTARRMPPDFPAHAGFESAGPDYHFEYVRPTHLPTVLERLRTRVWSSSWSLSDERLAELVATFEEVAIGEYGSVDGTVDDPRQFTVRRYRVPTGC